MQPPTAIQLFGPNPWVTDPAPGASSPSGIPIKFNPQNFATAATAALLCVIVDTGCRLAAGSCTVAEKDDITPFGPFKQNMPNKMVQFPDGTLHNAGMLAKFFDDFLNMPALNQAFSDEFGFPFTFVMPATAPKV